LRNLPVPGHNCSYHGYFENSTVAIEQYQSRQAPIGRYVDRFRLNESLDQFASTDWLRAPMSRANSLGAG
jgi:hypothetical protein